MESEKYDENRTSYSISENNEQSSATMSKDCNNECLSFALKRCSRAITQIYDQNLSSTGIRSTQFNLLMAIATSETRTLTQLAKILVMDRTTLTRNIKPLEKLALIQSVPSKDKRSKSYSLTEKGESVLSEAWPIWNRVQEQVKNVFPVEQELQDFINFLTKIVEKSRRI